MTHIKFDEAEPESLIRYLEKNEYRFRSGYLKEHIWHFLKRAQLTERQKARLREVAVMYLRKPMRREFFYMCRFIRLHADESFRLRVEQLTGSKDARVSERARLLSAYLQSAEAGAQARRRFHWRRWEKGRARANARFYGYQ